MLVYATRPLTDSLELVMAAVLTYLVAHCMKRTSETVYLQSMVQEAYEKASSVRDRVDIHKRKKLIPGKLSRLVTCPWNGSKRV